MKNFKITTANEEKTIFSAYILRAEDEQSARAYHETRKSAEIVGVVEISDAETENMKTRGASVVTVPEDFKPVEIVRVQDKIDECNEGDYGAELSDYIDGGTTYIDDAIHEIADSNTSIYYSDILKFISDHPDALADVIDAGLYDPSHNYDLYQHGQAAEYMLIYDDVNAVRYSALTAAGLRYYKRHYYNVIPSDLAEMIDDAAQDADRFDDITDVIDEYMNDLSDDARKQIEKAA